MLQAELKGCFALWVAIHGKMHASMPRLIEVHPHKSSDSFRATFSDTAFTTHGQHWLTGSMWKALEVDPM